MCDVCKQIHLDSKTLNGEREGLRKVKLLKYSPELRTDTLKLCYVHDIEFFVTGERRFFEKYFHIVQNYRSTYTPSNGNSLF